MRVHEMATAETGASPVLFGDKQLTEVRCFTNKEEEPYPEVYKPYFKARGKIVGKFESKQASNGTWFFVFSYEAGFTCAEGKHMINGLSVTVRFGTYNNSPRKSPSKRLKLNPQAVARKTLNGTTKLEHTSESISAFKFLLELREYGEYDRRRKGASWQQFSVLAVLANPLDSTQPFTYPVDLKHPKEFVEVAVPSSHTACLDAVDDANKSVVHAECKLVGDPGRRNRKLCVPYERCSLYTIIENHRMEYWEEHRTLPSVRYKIVLYSELPICTDCERALRKSVFHFSQKYNDLAPVVGHCLENATEANFLSYNKYGMDFIAGPNMTNGVSPYSIPLQHTELQPIRTQDLYRGQPTL